MNAIEQLQVALRKALPSATLALRTPRDPQGTFWLDASLDEHRVSVEWSARRGFGVSASLLGGLGRGRVGRLGPGPKTNAAAPAAGTKPPMKCGLASGLGVAVLLASSSGLALDITVEPTTPAEVGEARVYRVAKVADAAGEVTYRWNFGDGTVVGPGAAGEVEHTYATPGHYTVIVLGTDAQKARSSASFVQAAHPVLTQTPPSNSSSILYDASRNRIWNVNPDNHSVSVSDASSLERLREIPVGREPHALALGPDGSIWVANQHSDEIVVLDPESFDERIRIPLPYASQPRAVAFGPSGNAYVSLFATGELVEIDGFSHKLTRRLSLGPTPAGVSIAADGRIFVTRFVSPDAHGEVWLVSPSTFELVRTIELPLDPGPDSESTGRGLPNYVSSIAISPHGTQAWVTAKKDNVQRGPQRDGVSMNPDSFVRAIICVIDLATESEILEKRMDIDNRALPAQVAFSPVGDYAYLLLQGSNWLGIFDAYRASSISGIKDVGKAPDGLAFSADGKLFVNAFLSRALSVYDLRESLASRDHQAPEALAHIPSVDTEPLSEQVLLGKQVFYDASDKRMSDVGYMSCAACHLGGLGDGRVWDFTDRGEGLRNTKSLLGVAGARGLGRLHWSANFDEVQDFERDIRDSLGGTGFMTEADFRERAQDPFGTPSAGVSPELDALAAYVNSLDQAPRSPFRNPDGSFSDDARAGRELYLRAGCPNCHLESNSTNTAGGEVFDVGTLLPTSGHRLGEELVGIKTPSLKGLWQSAPYLHDGRASSLLDVFSITQDQMGITSNLSAAELQQLVRYLEELDDVPEPAPAPPPDTESVAEASSCAIRPARAESDDTWLPALLLNAWCISKLRFLSNDDVLFSWTEADVQSADDHFPPHPRTGSIVLDGQLNDAPGGPYIRFTNLSAAPAADNAQSPHRRIEMGTCRVLGTGTASDLFLDVSHDGLTDSVLVPPHGPEASRRLAGELIGASGRLQGSLAMPCPPV